MKHSATALTRVRHCPVSSGSAVSPKSWSRYPDDLLGTHRSIADHIRSELVVDALQMAIWRRQPPEGAIVHSDHGSQYTSWAFGRRLRAAGLLGSMGTIGDAYDNSMAESFFGTLQLELLDRRSWQTRRELSLAVFDYIEAFYNPERRHTQIGDVSPVEFEALHTEAAVAA
jgi:putative transposase